MEEKEEGVSLLDIIKVMLGRKLVLLIVTAVMTVVLMLAIIFGYNNNKEVYVSTFSYADPLLLENSYIDGSTFNYRSLITEDSLTAIKETDSSFSSIDIEALIENKGVSISQSITYNEATATVESKEYTITIKKKFFDSTKQAKKFVKAVTEQATNNNTTIVSSMTNDDYLTSYASSNMFDEMVNYLLSQYEYLEEGYEAMIEKYGNIILSDGKSVSAYQSNLNTYFSEHSLEVLEADLLSNIYLLDDSVIKEYQDRYDNYLYQYNLNTTRINELQAKVDILLANASNLQTLELSEYNAAIAKYTIENVEYKRLYVFYGNLAGVYTSSDSEYIEPATNDENAAFKTKLDTYYTKLVAFAKDYSTAYSGVVNANSEVYYNVSSVVTKTGGISIALALVGSVVVSFVIACVVNLVIDYKKLIEDSSNDTSEETVSE